MFSIKIMILSSNLGLRIVHITHTINGHLTVHLGVWYWFFSSYVVNWFWSIYQYYVYIIFMRYNFIRQTATIDHLFTIIMIGKY